MAVGIELIDHNGTLLAAMRETVGLSIAGQIEPSGKNSALDRLLPNGCSDDRPPPFNVLWESNID
jgi:hypothetical protein